MEAILEDGADQIESTKAEIAGAEPSVEANGEGLSLPGLKCDIGTPHDDEKEKDERRGKRTRRLTSKMLESPMVEKKTKKNSGGNDVKVKKGKKSIKKQGVEEDEPEFETGKVNSLSKSVATESSGIKKSKNSRASVAKTNNTQNKVKAVVEKEEEEPLALRKGKRKGENNAEVEAGVKQSRRSNVAEVLASTSTSRRGKKKVEMVEDQVPEKEVALRRNSRRATMATLKEKSPEKVKDEPKGKLRRGGRKLARVASLSVMMTESADEEAGAQPNNLIQPERSK